MDFNKAHNNRESELQYDEHVTHFGKQTLQVLNILRSGGTITSVQAFGMGIIDVRARIKSLRDAGINVLDRKIPNGKGAKEYYLEINNQ